jgi:hypothetical protein
LCGSEEPHLVAYPFALDLKPLFSTSISGIISPIIPAQPFLPPLAEDLVRLNSCAHADADTAVKAETETETTNTLAGSDAEAEALRHTERQMPFTDSQDLQRVCRDLQQWGERQNQVRLTLVCRVCIHVSCTTAYLCVCSDLQAWRKLKKLTQALFFHHFIIEGWVRMRCTPPHY